MKGDHIIDHLLPYHYTVSMGEPVRKVTVNLPADVLTRAQELTGKGITGTLVEGLLEIQRRQKRSALRRLRGRIRVNLDLEETRR